jgi:hypothetical protein
MAYETLPPHAPSFQSDITASLIGRVHNNPFHPTAERIQWPAKYDEFVRKSNEAMSALMVSDETGKLVDVLTGSLNAYHLQHIPQRGTTIQVSDGVIDTSLTNWQQGIVFFSTLPSADDFVFTYMAQPDRYYGEYLTQVADVLHEVQNFLGAGTTEGEGLRNAPLTFVTKSANLGARFPHGVDLSALQRDITIAGVTTQNIRLGNGLDTVEMRAAEFRVRGLPGGGSVDMFFGWDTGDTAYFSGGANFTGDVLINGNLTVTGAQIVSGGTVNVNDVVAQSKLVAEFAAILGITTSAMTYVGGGLEVTGQADFLGVGNKNARFDRNIELTDGALRGVTHEGKVDGLNPSTVELQRRFYHFDHGYLNQGYQEKKYVGTQISPNTGNLNIVTDTGMPVKTAADTNFFPEKFNDGDYVITIIDHPNASAENGKQIPVVSYNDSNGEFTLARNMDALGDGNLEFSFHHRYAEPDVVRAGAGLTVTINADAALAAVASESGRYKSRRSSASVLSLPDDATSYIFMKITENTAELEEDEPSFFYRTHSVASDEDVLLARVVTAGGSVTSAVNFRLNGRWDSEWVKVTAIGDMTGSHLLGNRVRTLDAGFSLEWAPDTGGAGGPGSISYGLTNTGGVNPFAFHSLTDEAIVLSMPDSGIATPFWVRMRAK